MKKIALAFAFLMAFGHSAFAEDEAILSEPPSFYEKVKAVIDQMDPQSEVLWNLENNEFQFGTSVAFVKLEPSHVHVADLRGGYSIDQTVYGSVVIDLAGLGDEILPDAIIEAFHSIPAPLKGFIRKYGAIGPWGGYSWDNDAPAYGVSAGVKVKLP